MDETELLIRVGVRDLLAKYQFLADSGKTGELAQLFLADATFRTNTEELVGRDQILDFFARTGKAFVSADLLPARHHLSSVFVTPGDDATATTYACFQLIGIHGLDHWGTYRDKVIHTTDGWRFANRKAKVEGHVAGSPIASLLGLQG
ncbi:nuclear transport factor 2 family protein [Mycobacterium sp. E796]|uniref:nuclear transport factor 2 family protein n=1 Tax=Mycobacterium sp. E796 TaxID=1834151 RepID=UPI000801C263|nr:nuclear transport factor 2 family protein [Mycobacterium sp. E796]OBI44857.1 polyketide cyclase [Mycobacterium sp. E796]